VKTYTGVIISAANIGPTPMVKIRVPSGDMLELRASTRVAIEAITLIGRRVRFQAELSEHTVCLTQPLFVLGSQFGLKAIGADLASEPPVRAARTAGR
jgi:hypothetical protein